MERSMRSDWLGEKVYVDLSLIISIFVGILLQQVFDSKIAWASCMITFFGLQVIDYIRFKKKGEKSERS